MVILKIGEETIKLYDNQHIPTIGSIIIANGYRYKVKDIEFNYENTYANVSRVSLKDITIIAEEE